MRRSQRHLVTQMGNKEDKLSRDIHRETDLDLTPVIGLDDHLDQ